MYRHFHFLLLALLVERGDPAPRVPQDADEDNQDSVHLHVLDFNDKAIKVFAKLPSGEHNVTFELIRAYDAMAFHQWIEKTDFINVKDNISVTFARQSLSSFLFYNYTLQLTLLSDCTGECIFAKTFVTDPLAEHNLTCSKWEADVGFHPDPSHQNYAITFSLKPAFRSCPFDEFTIFLRNASRPMEDISKTFSNATNQDVITISFPQVSRADSILIVPSKPYCSICLSHIFTDNCTTTADKALQAAEYIARMHFIYFLVMPSSMIMSVVIMLIFCFKLPTRAPRRERESQGGSSLPHKGHHSINQMLIQKPPKAQSSRRKDQIVFQVNCDMPPDDIKPCCYVYCLIPNLSRKRVDKVEQKKPEDWDLLDARDFFCTFEGSQSSLDSKYEEDILDAEAPPLDPRAAEMDKLLEQYEGKKVPLYFGILFEEMAKKLLEQPKCNKPYDFPKTQIRLEEPDSQNLTPSDSHQNCQLLEPSEDVLANQEDGELGCQATNEDLAFIA